jgi:hypothetical protein
MRISDFGFRISDFGFRISVTYYVLRFTTSRILMRMERRMKMLPKFRLWAGKPSMLFCGVLVLTLLAHLMLALPASTSFAAAPTQSSSDPLSPEPTDATCPAGGQCFTDVPSGNTFYEFINRIYRQDLVSGFPCGGPGEPCDAENRPYYRPAAVVSRQQMAKFIDNSRRLPQIRLNEASSAPLIYARNPMTTAVYAESGAWWSVYGLVTSTTGGIGVKGEMGGPYGGIGVFGVANGTGDGVRGESEGGDGVSGYSATARGVEGISTGGTGVYGASEDGTGVFGRAVSSDNAVAAIWGDANAPAWAGMFEGNVQVTGNLSKGGGSFKIDHPLDPADKYLYHSFVESPDMMNIYNGNVTTDAGGQAVVALPDWFEALNTDFRYQLTTVGQHADAWIAAEIVDNAFTIETDKPFVKVSWQVTGVRQDPYANAHRIPVEEDKPAGEQGKYLHPEEWGRPESLGIHYEEQQRIGIRD